MQAVLLLEGVDIKKSTDTPYSQFRFTKTIIGRMLTTMAEKLTKKHAGRLGGLKKWSVVPKEERIKMMREVALARWNKKA